MSVFDQPYWNLEQAAAWIVYRKREVVEQLGPASTESLSAMMMFPSMMPYPFVGKVKELANALTGGAISAAGRRNPDGTHFEPIPKLEWSGLWLRPPKAYRQNTGPQKVEPWVDIRVASEEVRKLWPTLPEQHDRAKYDWDLIRSIYDEIVQQLPESSQNEQILELQGLFEERTNKRPPSRSVIQDRIKRWTSAGLTN